MNRVDISEGLLRVGGAGIGIGRAVGTHGMSMDAPTGRVLRGMAERNTLLLSHGQFWPAFDVRLSRIREDYVSEQRRQLAWSVAAGAMCAGSGTM